MPARRSEVVYDKRPTTFQYILQLLRHGLSLTSVKEFAHLFAYYVINHVKGMRRAHIGKGARIWPTVLLRNAERIYIGENTTINHNNVLWAGRASAAIRIGKDVMTGPNVSIIAYNHYVEDGMPLPEHFTEDDVVIEDNVWLGAGVTVLAGASIGRGCVVGSGAVVDGELPPHTVCVGVPARVVSAHDGAEQQRTEHG